MTENQAIKNIEAFQNVVSQLAKQYGIYTYQVTGFVGDPGRTKEGYPFTVSGAVTDSISATPHGQLVAALFRSNSNIMVQYGAGLISYQRVGNKVSRPHSN